MSPPHHLGDHRQRERELTALAERALDPDPATVQLDERPGDREAQASAADAPGVRVVDAVEAFPDAWQVLRRDTNTLVAHGDPQKAARRVIGRQLGSLLER